MQRREKELIVLYGSGFSALTVACVLKSKGRDILVCSPSKRLGGVMSSLSLFGELIDIGPQFLENLNVRQYNLLSKFIDVGLTKEIKMSCGSYYDKTLNTEFAIPNLTGISEINKNNLVKRANEELTIDLEGSTLEDYIRYRYADLSEQFLKISNKLLGVEPGGLDIENYKYLEFGGRLRLYDDAVTRELKKKSVQFKKSLAESRDSLEIDMHSIYPKVGPIYTIIQSMIDYLLDSDTPILTENFTIDLKDRQVSCAKNKYNYKEFILIDKHDELFPDFTKYKVNRPCLFHYFKLEQSLRSRSNYIVNYDASMHSTRLTNYTCYRDDISNIICIEEPVKSLSQIDTKENSMKCLNEFEEILDEKVAVLSNQTISTKNTFPLWKFGASTRIQKYCKMLQDTYDGLTIISPMKAQRTEIINYCLNI